VSERPWSSTALQGSARIYRRNEASRNHPSRGDPWRIFGLLFGRRHCLTSVSRRAYVPLLSHLRALLSILRAFGRSTILKKIRANDGLRR